MLNDRLQEIVEKANSPFVSGSVNDGPFFVADTKDAFSIDAMCRPENVLQSIAAVVGEVERARKGGFTQTELNRAKAEQLRYARDGYEDRDKRRNSEIVDECVQNFTGNSPMLSPGDELKLVEQLDSTISLRDINAATADIITDSNQVVTLYGPTENGFRMPSQEDIEKTILKAQAAQYTPYEDKALPTALIAHSPKAGKIVKEEKSDYGYTHITLSNGMNVYVKSTDFEADEIDLKIFSPGGCSLYPGAYVPSLSFVASAINACGLADFDARSLEKMLTGKTVNVAPYVEDEEEGITGSSSKADIKTLFELTYLYFTAPRRDDEAFQSMMDRQRSFLKNRDASPMVAYSDSLKAIIYGHNPRLAPITVSTLDKVSLDRILQIYKERFADAADFDVILTGNID
ncbi:MAG: insulinase family protein, partial [Paraprevotella sp.]|nr:insulinase family protein [Paraprevotella sp.]